MPPGAGGHGRGSGPGVSSPIGGSSSPLQWRKSRGLSFPGRLKTHPLETHFVFLPIQSAQRRGAGLVAATESGGQPESLWAGPGWAEQGWAGAEAEYCEAILWGEGN